MKKVLVTGGAGYVGCVLVPELLREGFQVRVIDKLLFGGDGILACFRSQNFEFIRGDVLDETLIKKAVKDVDAVIHLAAIVGYPACKQNPDLARKVNVTATEILSGNLSKNQLAIYASTGSNYGSVVGQLCTEETPLNPLTIYGETKTQAERQLLEHNTTIAYRFATAFGLSPRLRLDLLINDFVFQALKRKNLIIYEKGFKRTFIHVYDMARAFVFALKNADKMKQNVYNVGSDNMNFDKEQIAQMIKKKIEFYLHFADIGKDEDQRNYEVSYKKIRDLGYTTTLSVETGVDEMLRGMQVIDVRNPYSNV